MKENFCSRRGFVPVTERALWQDSKKAPMMKSGRREQMAQRRTERMTEKLNLSEKQSAAL